MNAYTWIRTSRAIQFPLHVLLLSAAERTSPFLLTAHAFEYLAHTFPTYASHCVGATAAAVPRLGHGQATASARQVSHARGFCGPSLSVVRAQAKSRQVSQTLQETAKQGCAQQEPQQKGPLKICQEAMNLFGDEP
jgi:hypothetical protein